MKIREAGQQMAAAVFHHGSQSQAPLTPEQMAQANEHEKEFIAHFSDTQRPLAPGEVAESPRNKELGKSSKGLSIRDFELVRTLGTGTFARVWLVRLANPAEEDRDKVFALKVLRKVEVIKLKQVDHVNHERSVLADVAGHPFITTLITSFSDHDSLYMLLDYCPGGEVFSYLRKAKRFDENTSRFYAAEIVLILEYLHEREGVAYRDLKPENLLLDGEGHIKLVDFGFAKRLGNSEQQKHGKKSKGNVNIVPGETYTLCGTPEYLAPEVIQSKGHTTAVDWWALGILIYEFLTGYPPFWNSNPIEIYKQIVSKPVHFPNEPAISPEAKDIIRQFCTVDRSKRLGNISGGAARVKEHPFFNGVIWEDVYYRKYRGPIIPPIRYPGDAQCFDTYPDEKAGREPYSDELKRKWEDHFKDF
ncbi:camp-dependent protein kinase A [Mollisia scopiformis]|uniref:cAMP-dependent protein kinase n=1 Tax=Mollisia scopiformis TaxID=149040 RepID=A0A132B1P5_MOLSC|nr:camp-dependent protein kinase A [Mollisia scopiformis]KUJ06300.1 camp-dependent protein kinase A [Mollisia scopiformis]